MTCELGEEEKKKQIINNNNKEKWKGSSRVKFDYGLGFKPDPDVIQINKWKNRKKNQF